MKKYLLVLFMVLALSGVAGMAFAQNNSITVGADNKGDISPSNNNNYVQPWIGSSYNSGTNYGTLNSNSPSATGGAGGNAVGVAGNVVGIAPGGVTISPTIKPETNIGNGIGNFSPKATIERGAVDVDNTNVGINKNVNINKPTFNNDPTFNNTNRQGQKQGQSQGQKQGQDQGQFQGQNNDQTIAPTQSINFEAPKRVAVGTAPQDSGQTELNFIAPNERDVTTILPSFGCGTIQKLTVKDCIIGVVWQSNDIKFKDLYKEVLKGVRSDEVMKSTVAIRYQIWEAASTKSWTTGGSLSGNGIGQIGTVVSGGSAGIFPQVGRSKSSNLYTILFVQVQEFKK